MIPDEEPKLVRVVHGVATLVRDVGTIAVLVASAVTVGALWATRSVRADIQRIDERTARTGETIELLVSVATAQDSSERESVIRELRKLRRVFPNEVRHGR